MKISANDVALAHAVARAEVKKVSDRMREGFGRRILESRSVKEFVRNVEKMYPGRIIDCAIGRAIGGRATAGVVVADSTDDGTLALVQLVFDARKPVPYRVSPHAVPLMIQQHALARVIQRVTGESSLPKVVAAIQPWLHAALLWAVKENPMDPKTEVAISGRGLEVAGAVDDTGILRLKTVINAEGMQSANRQMWAMGEEITVRVLYTPPD